VSNNSTNKRLLIGQINGLFGVQGWVKLFSHANPRKNILSYQPWHVEVDGQWKTLEIVKGRVQGKTIVPGIILARIFILKEINYLNYLRASITGTS